MAWDFIISVSFNFPRCFRWFITQRWRAKRHGWKKNHGWLSFLASDWGTMRNDPVMRTQSEWKKFSWLWFIDRTGKIHYERLYWLSCPNKTMTADNKDNIFEPIFFSCLRNWFGNQRGEKVTDLWYIFSHRRRCTSKSSIIRRRPPYRRLPSPHFERENIRHKLFPPPLFVGGSDVHETFSWHFSSRSSLIHIV